MLTEDEAKTKWCPFARVGNKSGRAHASNRLAIQDSDKIDIPFNSFCIGSACMAWRQSQKRNPDWKPNHSFMSGPILHPDDEEPAHIPDEAHGYCGLAGRL